MYFWLMWMKDNNSQNALPTGNDSNVNDLCCDWLTCACGHVSHLCISKGGVLNLNGQSCMLMSSKCPGF